MSDDARRQILQRRARFVAAAVTSLGIATSCGEKPKPQPCLSQTATPTSDAGPPPAEDTGTAPTVCLSVAPQEAGPEADIVSEPSPKPCLSQPPPQQDAGPKPQPCLKVAPPKPMP